MAEIRVLFVCLGNICRSPTAEGVFRRVIEEAGLAPRFFVDSAGTAGYHEGEPPDPRTQAAARGRGIDLSRLRARKIVREDFTRFDHILAMDRQNLRDLARLCPAAERHRLGLFLRYANGADTDEVPDPYYGGPDGFERVLDLAEAGARGLLRALTRQSA